MSSNNHKKHISTCISCGWCCQGSGLARLVPGDIPRIAAYIKLSEYDFLNSYCIKNRRGTFLKLKSGRETAGDCVFLENNRCRIHDVKPLRCASWPNWPELKKYPAFFEEACLHCSMINRETQIHE